MITIIIPCYNAENYIQRNFNSLIEQASDNFEVIYVNDGSVDSSEILLNNIAQKYSFVSVYTITNSGAMQARKKGLEYAKYDYVTFLDVDDVLDSKFITTFKSEINLKKFDIIGSNFKILQDNKYILLNTFSPGIYSKNNFLESLCQYSGWELCGKVYKKSLFKNISYPEKVAIGEDALIFFQLVCNADVIKILDQYLYVYIQNSSSISHVRDLKMCRDGMKSAIFIQNYLYHNSSIEKKYLDSLILLFFSNSLHRGVLKRSDIYFLKVKQALNGRALRMLPLKKRIIVIVGFILMGLNF